MADYIIEELRDADGNCIEKAYFCDTVCMNDFHDGHHPWEVKEGEVIQIIPASDNPVPEEELECAWCSEDLLEGDY